MIEIIKIITPILTAILTAIIGLFANEKVLSRSMKKVQIFKQKIRMVNIHLMVRNSKAKFQP